MSQKMINLLTVLFVATFIVNFLSLGYIGLFGVVNVSAILQIIKKQCGVETS